MVPFLLEKHPIRFHACASVPSLFRPLLPFSGPSRYGELRPQSTSSGKYRAKNSTVTVTAVLSPAPMRSGRRECQYKNFLEGDDSPTI